MAASKVSLKLFIDREGKKVLFAEASKDFVDFLFNILSLPVGTVIRLVTKNEMVGCLGNLYKSIENIDETYIQPNQNKDTLLKPKAPTNSDHLLLLNDDVVPSMSERKYYMCNSLHLHVTDNPTIACPSCHYAMAKPLSFVSGVAEKARTAGGGGSGGGGYVKEVVTYMVMDDLSVTPMSTISSITLLNKFNVKQVGNLEEKVVHLDMTEGVKLLKASLESKMVLTSVFLGQRVLN